MNRPLVGPAAEPRILNSANAVAKTGREIKTAAILGPPNSGKSTLFNRLTALRQKVANYPGVTVEHRTGTLPGSSGQEITLIDLPGVYDLTAYSEDERVAAQVLRGEMPDVGIPDAVLIVVDATNLERHLTIVPAVLQIGLPALVILNMADLLAERGGSIDLAKLAGQLDVPVALVSATEGRGIEAITGYLQGNSHARANKALPVLQEPGACHRWAVQVERESEYRAPLPSRWSRLLYEILLHAVWGPATFLVVVVLLFQVVFAIGQPLNNSLQTLLNHLGQLAFFWLREGFLRSVLFDGVWRGLSSILVFLPQILVLFLFITFLEDTADSGRW